MKQIIFSSIINALQEKVWHTLTDQEVYKEWAKHFSSESQYKGEWVEGSEIVFFDPNMGGTKAVLERVVPGEHIFARHIAMMNKDGSEDTTSEMAQKWIGITEEYKLKESVDTTELQIIINTHEDFEDMFNSMWPPALKALKSIAENPEK